MCGNMKIARTYVIKLQITHTHIYRIMRPTINMCLISHYTLGANGSTTKNCLYISFTSKTPLNNHFVCAYHLICCTEAVEKLGQSSRSPVQQRQKGRGRERKAASVSICNFRQQEGAPLLVDWQNVGEVRGTGTKELCIVRQKCNHAFLADSRILQFGVHELFSTNTQSSPLSPHTHTVVGRPKILPTEKCTHTLNTYTPPFPYVPPLECFFWLLHSLSLLQQQKPTCCRTQNIPPRSWLLCLL